MSLEIVQRSTTRGMLFHIRQSTKDYRKSVPCRHYHALFLAMFVPLHIQICICAILLFLHFFFFLGEVVLFLLEGELPVVFSCFSLSFSQATVPGLMR